MFVTDRLTNNNTERRIIVVAIVVIVSQIVTLLDYLSLKVTELDYK